MKVIVGAGRGARPNALDRSLEGNENSVMTEVFVLRVCRHQQRASPRTLFCWY